jgi:uridine phosphorylase
MKHSELILNSSGSIYHLDLHPEEVAPTVLTVGDPGRVERVSRHFDRIDTRRQKREFITHTGEIAGQRVSVISTGIGPDNIDIVLNELDALVNIDLPSRTELPEMQSLRIIRLGTTGSLQPDIPVDALVCSTYGIGLDNLITFYPPSNDLDIQSLESSFKQHMNALGLPLPQSYAGRADAALLQQIAQSASAFQGITLTMPGFYGPQGRSLRLKSLLPPNFFEEMAGFRHEEQRITNLEMETGALYALGARFGHQVLSCNTVLANRPLGQFSPNPAQAVDQLILKVLGAL